MIKLTKLSVIAGQSPGHGGVEITDPEVVLLVGPNNSGKSLALREIENWCIGQNETRKVIDQLDVSLPATADAAIELFQPFKTEPPENQTTAVDHMWLGLPTFRQNQPVIHEQVSLQTFRSWFGQPQGRHHARVQLARLYTVRLDGRVRFALGPDHWAVSVRVRSRIGAQNLCSEDAHAGASLSVWVASGSNGTAPVQLPLLAGPARRRPGSWGDASRGGLPDGRIGLRRQTVLPWNAARGHGATGHTAFRRKRVHRGARSFCRLFAGRPLHVQSTDATRSSYGAGSTIRRPCSIIPAGMVRTAYCRGSNTATTGSPGCGLC